jgi:ubiquitin carboxyl-terminal hydrolase MINDY-1/2
VLEIQVQIRGKIIVSVSGCHLNQNKVHQYRIYPQTNLKEIAKVSFRVTNRTYSLMLTLPKASGIIPMTARLSIFDQPEDPWGQPSQQPDGGVALPNTESVTQTSSDKGKMPATESGDNTYAFNQTEQEWDTDNHWQELSLRPESANVSNGSSSQQIPRASSPQLIDLEDTPTNTEANPWSSERRPDPPPKDKVEDQPPTSQPPPPTLDPLPPMSEAELKNFQEKQAETYAIRHINWTDYTGQLRESPVLVQSRNGPCPLLALVNGLIMRSDRKAQPPIVRALQTRENISLGLLIQALFDELVTYSNEELPDIEALSRFLTMLHTGMNVNPRLTLGSPAALGSFFETKDIQLYDSFKVPLVHGWIATPASGVHDSMVRVAQYYEDIQLLRFRKEEIEDRVFRNGATLTPDEERLMNDIQTIDQFVNIENTTQLTEFGLDHLGKTLPPGSVSILFRNDHFSTLYKHPQSGQLFTLITDAGYADHAEVVWESLVDITGANTEYYAGDFRPVGHGPSAPGPAGPSHLVSQRNSSRNNGATTSSTPSQHTTEQEDADYAYALSLQFQEEAQQQQERQRQPNARSSSTRVASTAARNTVPAHRYSQSTASGSTSRLRNPSVSSSSLQSPPRRNENNNNLHNIPQDAPGAADNDDDIADDAPPPSYEQVARNKAAEMFNRQQQPQPQPGLGPNTEYGTRRIQPYPSGSTPTPSTGRRQPLQSVPDRRAQASRDKDCIVM